MAVTNSHKFMIENRKMIGRRLKLKPNETTIKRAACSLCIVLTLVLIVVFYQILSSINREIIFVNKAGEGDVNYILQAIKKGESPNSQMKSISACDFAAFRGQSEVVRLLLEHGAGVSDGIFRAVENDDIAVAKLYLDHGVDPKKINTKRYCSPFDFAIQKKSYKVLHLFETYRKKTP